MLGSDRGTEFRSVLIQEYVALMGIRHRYGTAWRPVEQGIVERSHQELRKIMGMLMCDVLRAYASEWSELPPVMEFLIYTTPGAHRYSPRDLDRRWSFAIPLGRELTPFVTHDYETMNEYARGMFRAYRDMRARVIGWHAASSAKRAELANRWRKTKKLQPGDLVVFRDPRAKAAGGRAPYKEPLSDPYDVVRKSQQKSRHASESISKR